MRLEIATLVAGTETPAGDGINGALRCVITLNDRSLRSAYLKRGTQGEIVAESFSALLLRAWNLPVPQPFLVQEEGSLSFASADMQYPNLKQYMGMGTLPPGPAFDAVLRIAICFLCGLSTATLAAACDEAIDNRDRNLWCF